MERWGHWFQCWLSHPWSQLYKSILRITKYFYRVFKFLNNLLRSIYKHYHNNFACSTKCVCCIKAGLYHLFLYLCHRVRNLLLDPIVSSCFKFLFSISNFEKCFHKLMGCFPNLVFWLLFIFLSRQKPH